MERVQVTGKDRIILPLDVDSADKAVELVQELKDDVGAFKVGLELVNSVGFGIFQEIDPTGHLKIFYDGKFHDIPNTVAGASRAVGMEGHWMYNVHCAGGPAMMKAATEASTKVAKEAGLLVPLVLGVTVLTSINWDELSAVDLYDHELWRRYYLDVIASEELPATDNLNAEAELRLIRDLVVKRAKAAKNSGLDCVVASPLEIQAVREACGPDFLIVTPGVRPAGADVGDQKRVMTPGEAIRLGSDYLVIGRPIIKADNPKAAAQAIAKEIDLALAA